MGRRLAQRAISVAGSGTGSKRGPVNSSVKALLAGWVAGLLVVAWGCSKPPTTSMVRLPPPPHWSDDIARSRAAKDDFMITAPDSPLLEEDKAAFAGLSYWDPNDAYYQVGHVELYPTPEPLEIITTAGEVRPAERVGRLSFQLADREFILQVYRMVDSTPNPGTTGYFLPFKDQTAGAETYPSGRYVELTGNPAGPFVLDFNRAYNPYCAYGEPERFACPVTPRENHLDVRIEAGERGYKHGTSSS